MAAKYVVTYVPADGGSRPVFAKDMDNHLKVAMYASRETAERRAGIYHKGEVVEYDPSWPAIHPDQPL